MLYNNITKELLGLQDVELKKVENKNDKISIHIEMNRKKQKCPCCSVETSTIHDYRIQSVKDISAFGKNICLVLRKRRYRCNNCNKRFFESNTFLAKYKRMTNRLIFHILNSLRNERSFTNVAKENRLSVTTVIRYFDFISYPKAKLPTAISIDEFKGNTDGEKYQCIITDPVNKTVLDILPQRYEHYLVDYFKLYPKAERQKVECFVSDMWKPYANISKVWFKNAVQIVDKYHWIRQAIWAFERVRKEEQKKLGSDLRKYFKRSRSLLNKRYDSLDDDEKRQVNVMLYYSVNISRAYFYKEDFLKILDFKDSADAKTAMLEWIDNAVESDISHFVSCAKTMRNWLPGIMASFSSSVTNGFTEGCNNKIKVLKRNAYGYSNFNRFRNRILHMFSHQIYNIQ